jgi:hypothetical protein
MKTRFFLSVIFSMLFALVSGAALAAGSGLSLLPVSGVIFGASFIRMPAGIMPMAIQKEIWMATIVEGLFANNSFLSKAFNADEFVNNGKTVHIPNAGAGSTVVKNRNSFPATVSARTDNDLTFDLDEFTTDPIRIPQAETVELSYNKRESAIRVDRATLIDKVGNDFTYNWSPISTYSIRTTGSAVAAHTASATGYRKALVYDDLLAAMNYFNNQDIPQEGRYALIDAVMYGQLLNSLTPQAAMAFHSTVDVANGILGKLLTFNIMMRSKASRYTTGLTAKLWTTAGAATDNAAALCWHTNSICRALGEIVVFDNPGDPLYYGDIFSFLVRSGGRIMRNDVAGVLAIIQNTSAAPES